MVVARPSGLIPFLLAAGLTYLGLLRDHDINYYLRGVRRNSGSPAGIDGDHRRSGSRYCWRERSPVGSGDAAGMFENVNPRQALGESAACSSVRIR